MELAVGMLDKVNVTKIVRDHLETFKDNSTRKYRPLDFLLFFLVPLLVAAGFAGILGALPTNLIGVIATSLSIFTALLLNLLLLAYNIARNSEPPSDEGIQEMREKLFHEIFSNIAFAVLVALVTVGAVLMFGVMSDCASLVATYIVSAVIYYLGTLFLLTLLMLLKRVYALLSNEQVTSSN